MRVALITEGAQLYPLGGVDAWCDRLVRGMPGREFDLHVLAPGAGGAGAGAGVGDGCGDGAEWVPPENVRGVHVIPGPDPRARPGRPPRGRRRRAYREHHEELVRALTARDTGSQAVADRFSSGLYGLAGLAREDGALDAFLRSDDALGALEAACRAPGALPAVAGPGLRSLLAAADLVEQGLRPLSAPWYGDASEPGSLAAADLCHAASGGPAALPGLLAGRWFGTPLLVTEYGIRLRDGYVAWRASAHGSRVRALGSAFHRLLAAETYRVAALATPGNTHNRRWQERCGADRDRIRTVYPGYPAADTRPFTEAEGEPEGEPEEPTLVWVGRLEPAKDLFALLHAFAEVRRRVPGARLRIVDTGGAERGHYAEQCRALAAQLFPDEARDARSVGESPVAFETVGTPEVPGLDDAYAAGSVVVLSSIVEGFPRTLVEAMFCGRATVSTDAGGVREVIGGTGLVVPPRNPKALAGACLELLEDRGRRDRLGAAARARAQELFTEDQNLAAFDQIYLELLAHRPAGPGAGADVGADRRAGAGAGAGAVAGAGAGDLRLPFARPPEALLPGRWASDAATGLAGDSTRWVPGRVGSGGAAPVGAAARRPSWARHAAQAAGAGATGPVRAAFGGGRP